ncbi:histidinol-phosphate transaminase [Algiphilus sp. W345]|uniref:Histidinol-phosphate aminotransferase n=1 Tax=Banduia mediterranea TaxID=3075609 RepID=A0ABU2WH95_9GAMM|nr:histidinol-phosphate transaminase [Algiphilus sp. W345]MDT0497240.1 histidinol-phosphate transaminase [Algiphilus sp. W345]
MNNPAYLKNALPGVLQLAPYQPGMPLEELQRRLGVKDAIKLASNENPLGASPAVCEMLAATARGELSRYPDGGGFRLKKKLAAYHGVDADCITLGNGSNDLLEFVSRVFLGPGRAALFSQYAFAVYSIATQAQNAEAIVVPALPRDHASMPMGHDLEGFARELRDDVAAVFIANPNNPTGTWLAPEQIEAFLEEVPEQVVVVLDEAYFDYQAPALRTDSRALLSRYPNLLVTRTFSKVYGLASLRVGYGLSHPSLADLLNRVRQPFNNNSLALLAAELALEDQDFVRKSVELNTRELARMTAEVHALGLKTLPSQANFLTIDFGRDASPIHQGLLERGVIVRPMGSYKMPDFIRVSIGTGEENSRFINTLKDILKMSSGA